LTISFNTKTLILNLMHGWAGKTVTIDLTDSKIEEVKSDGRILRSFIGGRGLGVKLYYDAIDPNIEPLSPENILIFATGPLTGTAAPLSGRHVMVSKCLQAQSLIQAAAGFSGKR
jgi:aldehyde:ferredoxin oxidoreductase